MVNQNRENFISKANEKHSSRFGYDDLIYVNMHTPIDILCPSHGTISISPYNHLRSKYGCPRCSRLSKKTDQWYIDKFKTIHGDWYDYSQFVFVSATTKGIISCPVHGEFQQSPNTHSKGHGCISCSGTAQKTTGEVIDTFTNVGKQYFA